MQQLKKETEKDEKLQGLSSFVSKRLKEKFGKGPVTCTAFTRGPFIIFYIREFISPMEKSLFTEGRNDIVHKSREVIIESMIEELKNKMKEVLGREVEEFYHDWNYHTNNGMVVALINQGKREIKLKFKEHQVFEEEFAKVSNLFYKVPDEVNAYQIADHIYVVNNEGVIHEIEKYLIEKGHIHNFYKVEQQIKQYYSEHKSKFERILGKSIEDIFTCWDFDNNKNLLCFVTK